MPQGIESLKLNPQEQFLYDLHANNLRNPVINPDGSISTLRQMTVEVDGRTYNVPKVWNGKILDDDAAMQRAREVGLDKFPSYPTREEAQKRYDEMHKFMEQPQPRSEVTPNDLQANYDGIGGFLGGLWDAMKLGAKNTGLALRDDWTDIQEHNLPHNLMRDLPGLVTMAGSPEITPSIPAAPQIKWVPSKNPVLANAGVEDALVKAYPGGNPIDAYFRSGTANPVLEEMYRMWDQARNWTMPTPRGPT